MWKTINLCKLLFLSAILLSADLVSAQYNETFKGDFPAESEITIRHRRGPVKVIKATNGRVSYEASLRFDATDKAEAQKLISAFGVKAGNNGGRIDIASSAGIKNMRTINGKSTIELEDGTKIKGIQKLEISLLVKVPETRKLKIDSRYHEVDIDAAVSELLVVHTYSSTLEVKDIKGDLEFLDKYSKGTIGSFRNARMELYESKFQFGNGRETEVNAKYSTLRFPQLDALSTQSYESKFYVGPIKGKLEINDKYSDFEFENIQDALMDIYETDITAGKVQKVQIKSKYSDLRFTAVEEIYFASSYEDKFKAQEVGILRAAESKYSNYKMEQLTGALELSSYEDDITIENTVNNLKTILIKGKYTTLICPLASSMKFKLNMEGRYGSIDLDDEDLNYSTYLKKSSEFKIVGTRNNATDADAKIAFDCYECKIRLKN